jgi:hypothetical protein
MYGFWKIELSLEGGKVCCNELSDVTREHIAELIQQGFNSGEIVEAVTTRKTRNKKHERSC